MPETFDVVLGGLTPQMQTRRLDLGPTHPVNAGLLQISVEHHDGHILSLDPQPGALHRGAELLFEVRDYRQALSLANRHDWQAPAFGELLWAQLVETELGIEIPDRARWLRTLLAEHHRLLSHLGFLTFVGFRLARPDLATDAAREHLRTRSAELTGNRLHPMAVRLGGVAFDVTPTWAADERATVRAASTLAHDIGAALTASGLGCGVAPLTPALIAGHGLAGPIARASGLAHDLRRDAANLAYPELAALLQPPSAPTTGDAHARLAWLAAEVAQSAALVEACLDGLPSGELSVKLPKVVKLPEGDAHAAIEAPLGRAGLWIVSRGEKTPWRARLRTPSAANVSAWSTAFVGTPLADLDAAVASLPYVPGDLDK